MHAGPGQAAVCRVKLCPVRCCGYSAKVVDGANVDDRLSGRTTRHHGKRNGFHPRLAAIGRALDRRRATTRHRLRGFEGETDSLAATDSRSANCPPAACTRRRIRARRPETPSARLAPVALREAREGAARSAGGSIAWFVATSTQTCLAKLRVHLPRLRFCVPGARAELNTAARLVSASAAMRCSPATLPQAQPQAASAGRFGTNTQMATAVAAAVMGTAQRNRRAGVQAWRASAGGAVRSIAARTAMHRAQLDACASTAAAACACSAPSAQAASVSASRQASSADCRRLPQRVAQPVVAIRFVAHCVSLHIERSRQRFLARPSRTASARPYVEDLFQIRRHQRPLSRTRNTAQSARRSIHDRGEIAQRRSPDALARPCELSRRRCLVLFQQPSGLSQRQLLSVVAPESKAIARIERRHHGLEPRPKQLDESAHSRDRVPSAASSRATPPARSQNGARRARDRRDAVQERPAATSRDCCGRESNGTATDAARRAAPRRKGPHRASRPARARLPTDRARLPPGRAPGAFRARSDPRLRGRPAHMRMRERDPPDEERSGTALSRAARARRPRTLLRSCVSSAAVKAAWGRRHRLGIRVAIQPLGERGIDAAKSLLHGHFSRCTTLAGDQPR